MKKQFLLVVMLCMFFYARATTMVNNTSCDAVVTQYCYDANCNIISTRIYPLPANSNIIIAPQCPNPNATAYLVCWQYPDCDKTCAFVEGGNSGCGPGLFLKPLPRCPYCSTRDATVFYNYSLDMLSIGV